MSTETKDDIEAGTLSPGHGCFPVNSRQGDIVKENFPYAPYIIKVLESYWLSGLLIFHALLLAGTDWTFDYKFHHHHIVRNSNPMTTLFYVIAPILGWGQVVATTIVVVWWFWLCRHVYRLKPFVQEILNISMFNPDTKPETKPDAKPDISPSPMKRSHDRFLNIVKNEHVKFDRWTLIIAVASCIVVGMTVLFQFYLVTFTYLGKGWLSSLRHHGRTWPVNDPRYLSELWRGERGVLRFTILFAYLPLDLLYVLSLNLAIYVLLVVADSLVGACRRFGVEFQVKLMVLKVGQLGVVLKYMTGVKVNEDMQERVSYYEQTLKKLKAIMRSDTYYQEELDTLCGDQSKALMLNMKLESMFRKGLSRDVKLVWSSDARTLGSISIGIGGGGGVGGAAAAATTTAAWGGPVAIKDMNEKGLAARRHLLRKSLHLQQAFEQKLLFELHQLGLTQDAMRQTSRTDTSKTSVTMEESPNIKVESIVRLIHLPNMVKEQRDHVEHKFTEDVQEAYLVLQHQYARCASVFSLLLAMLVVQSTIDLIALLIGAILVTTKLIAQLETVPIFDGKYGMFLHFVMVEAASLVFFSLLVPFVVISYANGGMVYILDSVAVLKSNDFGEASGRERWTSYFTSFPCYWRLMSIRYTFTWNKFAGVLLIKLATIIGIIVKLLCSKMKLFS